MRGTLKLGALAVVVALVNCSDAPEPAAPAAGPRAEGAVTAGDPYGLRSMVLAMQADTPVDLTRISPDITLRYMGKGNMLAGPPDFPTEQITQTRRADAPVAWPLTHRFYLRAFNTRTHNEFQISVTERLFDEINSTRARAGLLRSSEGVTSPDSAENIGGVRGSAFTLPVAGEITTQGWSNGVDTRVIVTPTTNYFPRRVVSQFTYGTNDSRCSGTLIGPRHVVTAGHCVVDQGTNNWKTIKVTPGRDGTSLAPYGSATIKPVPDPGTEAWYFTLEEWRDPTTASPRQFDWALIVLPKKIGNTTGWMGYTAETFSQLSATNNWNRGYPSCDPTYAEKPAGCQKSRMYGDVHQCGLGGTSSPGPDGWNRLISASCDLSRGHSGSSIYHYYFDAGLNAYVPVVSMMVVSHTCFTCTPTDNFPNWARRLTPVDVQTISFFRQTFP
jgi:V8-like Glu-specific endopeptidase